MAETLTRAELDAWQTYTLHKPCQFHPKSLIKKGKYGLWCGNKNSFGYCDGGWPTEEFLKEFRKETI